MDPVVTSGTQPLASSRTQLSTGASIMNNIEDRHTLTRDIQSLGKEMTIIRRASARAEEIYSRIQERFGLLDSVFPAFYVLTLLTAFCYFV